MANGFPGFIHALFFALFVYNSCVTGWRSEGDDRPQRCSIFATHLKIRATYALRSAISVSQVLASRFSTKPRLNILIYLTLILLAGDVECNPGPEALTIISGGTVTDRLCSGTQGLSYPLSNPSKRLCPAEDVNTLCSPFEHSTTKPNNYAFLHPTRNFTRLQAVHPRSHIKRNNASSQRRA